MICLIINEQVKGSEVHTWVGSHLISAHHQSLHEGRGGYLEHRGLHCLLHVLHAKLETWKF